MKKGIILVAGLMFAVTAFCSGGSGSHGKVVITFNGGNSSGGKLEIDGEKAGNGIAGEKDCSLQRISCVTNTVMFEGGAGARGGIMNNQLINKFGGEGAKP